MKDLSAIDAAPIFGARLLQRDESDLRQAAEGFEALFVRRMLEAARAADLGGDDLFGSQGADTFTEMRDAHFAELAAKTGTLGIADMLEIQLQRQLRD